MVHRLLPKLAPTVTMPVPEDDPLKHQGRTRTQPHVDGQFASYIYAPITLDGDLGRLLKTILEDLRCRLPSMHSLVHLATPDASLHLSLSRPLYLRVHERETIKQAVKQASKESSRYMISSRQCRRYPTFRLRFTISFAAFAILTNDAKTRSFLALEIGAGHAQVCRGVSRLALPLIVAFKYETICSLLRPILQSLRQPAYYDRPRFHASFAWILVSSELSEGFPGELVDDLESRYGEKLRKIRFEVAGLEACIGKAMHRWTLA